MSLFYNFLSCWLILNLMGLLTLLLLSTFYWRRTYIQKHVQFKEYIFMNFQKVDTSKMPASKSGNEISQTPPGSTSHLFHSPPFLPPHHNKHRLVWIILVVHLSMAPHCMYCFALFSQNSIWEIHSAACWQSFNNWLIAGSQHEVADQSWEVSWFKPTPARHWINSFIFLQVHSHDYSTPTYDIELYVLMYVILKKTEI